MKFVCQRNYPHWLYITRTGLEGEEFEKGKTSTVSSSACGLCCAVMMADQLIPNCTFELTDAIDLSYATQSNKDRGTDYRTYAPALAEKLNLSASRTSHILREEFQKSFSDMLTESRIQRICDLLETTDLPLRDIAQRTGLSNEYYLNRFFKRKKGIPPGQYRISTPKTADTTEDKNL